MHSEAAWSQRLVIALLAVSCGGSGATTGPSAPTPVADEAGPAGAKAASEAPEGENSPPVPAPPSIPELDLKGPCGKTVEAHLRSRAEPNLELVAAVLYESCVKRKWDRPMHTCVASASSTEALILCRAGSQKREIERDIDDGPIAKTGVSACDDYYAEFIRCMAKINPQSAKQFRQNFHRAAVQLRDSARASSREAIARTCRQAHEQVAATYDQCKWSVP